MTYKLVEIVMRVLYFHQYFSTPMGKTGTRSYEMAQALIRAGHEVHLVCCSDTDGKTGLTGEFVDGKRIGIVDGIQITEFELTYSNYQSLLQRSRLFLIYAWRSMKVSLTEDYDLVFATSTPLTAGLPGIAARWLRRKRFVFEVRDLWPELPIAMGILTNPIVKFGLSALEWISYRSAHACIGLSPGIVEGILARSHPTQNVSMVPNGCDLSLFADGQTLTSESASLPGVSDSDCVAIFTGAHGIANGLDAVLDAAAVLQKRDRNDIKIVFLGDGKLKPALIKRAREEGLDNCVFLEPVEKVRMADYLRRADLALMVLANVPAFYYGTSPNKFFDYLAMSKPVLTNYPGWLAEIVESSGAGVVVPPESAELFADALSSLADDRGKLVHMGKCAHELARAKFDRALLSEEFVSCIETAALRR